jgi:hypothetical protein
LTSEAGVYEVEGTITGVEGHGLHGARVVVAWQHVRRQVELGSALTSDCGDYCIRYRLPCEAPGPVLLVVEAHEDVLEAPLRSQLLEARPKLRVDLEATARDRSELAALEAAVRPFLDGLELTDLVEDDRYHDITFIATELKTSPENVMRVAVCARLAAAYRIPAAAFYAFVRRRVPVSIPTPLLAASQDFELIDPLVRTIGSLVFGLAPDLQARTLEAAVAGHLIGAQYEGEIPKLVEQLQSERTKDVLEQPYLVGKPALGDLLDLAKLPAGKQQAFAQALASNTQSLRAFWTTLGDGTHGLTAAQASSVERTLSIGAFVKNHPPLVTLLLDGFHAGEYKNVSELARLSREDWVALVRKAGAPPSIDPAGEQTPEEVFAAVVYTRVTRAYSTVALGSRAAQATFVEEEQRAPLGRFFANNPSLDLLRHNVAAYLEQEGKAAFRGIGARDQAAVVANVRRFQRLLQVTPDVDSAETLLGLGLGSATEITMLGKQQFFLTATAAGISKPDANRLYDVAAGRYAGLVSLYTQFHRDAIGVWPKAVGQVSDLDEPVAAAVARDDSLATLFGSQDYCAVADCTSILSPAAYLCDLLYWLDRRLTGGTSAPTVLSRRRPDIEHLLLNCPNTDTPLPYIDLVNEILADAISPALDPGSATNPTWKQTTEDQTEASLRASPQYFNADAYAVLFGASYPHSLPYSDGLDELQTYLAKAGVPLWQLRRALLPLAGGSTAQLAAVAAARFGLPPHAVDLIANASFVAPTVSWNTADPPNDLVHVDAFMHASSLRYEQLLELLQVSWVQGGVGLAIEGVDDTCGTSIQTLAPAPLDGGLLDRAQRFLRLWRKTGYAMWELDLLLGSASVAGGTLDEAGLVALGRFRELQDATRLAVDEQLALFDDLDTGSHRKSDGSATTSLYARLFSTPAVTALDPDGDLAAVAAGDPLTDDDLSHHLPAIGAALGISAVEGQSLVTTFGLAGAGTLTLGNLSLLYRIARLASVAGLSLADLETAAGLLDPGAADVAAAVGAQLASLDATLAFLQQVKAIRQSGFTLDALAYLHTPPAGAEPLWTEATAMTDTAIAAVLTAVRQTILNPSGGDVPGSVIATVASQLGLANDVTALLMQPPGGMPQLEVPGSGDVLVVTLTDPSLTAPAGGPYPAIDRATYPDQFVAIQLLDKARVVIGRLHLVLADLSWLMANAGVVGGLDLTALPVTAAQPALGVEPLLTSVLAVKLARLWTAAPAASPLQSLYDVIGGVHAGTIADEASAQAALATITGWNEADIAALATSLGLAFPADYARPAAYDALRTLQSMLAAMGAKAAGTDLVAWGAVPADEPSAETAAASALGALKAQHPDGDEWLAFLAPLTDPIREHRSAALQDYLVGNGDANANTFADTDALLDWFLIDTQMSSCEVSTRVVQAYIAVQIFVERCRMNLLAPDVVVDPADDAWQWWSWMKRYRVWEAAREVFLYPENWLVESQRVNRTEIYEKLEQDVQQCDKTAGELESVVLDYVDGLDGIAHLYVTGTCTGADGTVYAIARTLADPPRYYYRSLAGGAWSGWLHLPLDIKAHQAVPAVYRGRLCVFWPEVKVTSEPRQSLPAAQGSSNPPSQEVSKYVSIGLFFSIFRNGSWSPAQMTKGRLFDVPLLSSQAASDSKTVEALYTLKVQAPTPAPGVGATLSVDVFRLGAYDANAYVGALAAESADYALAAVDLAAAQTVGALSGILGGAASSAEAQLEAAASQALGAAGSAALAAAIATHESTATHLGRAVFDGRFSDVELRNLDVIVNGSVQQLLAHAQSVYGPDALPLLPLSTPDPDLAGEPNLVPRTGALATAPANPGLGSGQTLPLTFTAVPLQQGNGPLLAAAPVPFRVVGPATDLALDPASYFFFQDNRRCYYVDTQKYYWSGSTWTPAPPSNPASSPFEARYTFHRFYHPYTRLVWHQLAGGGFDELYTPTLELTPDQVDPTHADVFSFQSTYQPVTARVRWGEDNEILDFTPSAAYSVYNWELFFHIPLYVAQLLSQNQQFEDAERWFHYIFDPTRQGPDAVPQRFWITQPLHNLTAPAILTERINQVLALVNQGDPGALAQVSLWRSDPFNPYLIADLRPVAYMKRTVMSYLDNLIAWADNLFATDSREALSEATLLYVIAAEVLGPQPSAIAPPEHADDAYVDLAPKLDAFANALVDIENTLGNGGGGGGGQGPPMPPQTFYFKIPPNDMLLGYWKTVADRLFKLRHCQNIEGVTRELALFDAPIDPGLLVRARAAGVDIGSVLSDVLAPLPNYRFTALYPQTLDFVNAVRAYGSSLQAALEKSDADSLALMLATNQQQLLSDADQIFDWQVQQAQGAIDALEETRSIADTRYNHYHDLTKPENFANVAEWASLTLQGTGLVLSASAGTGDGVAAGAHAAPNAQAGATGVGGTPAAHAVEGGTNIGNSAHSGSNVLKTLAGMADTSSKMANTIGSWMHRADDNSEKAAEALSDRNKADIQLAGAQLALQVAQQNQANHQTQEDQLQQQIDFLTGKFTNQDLYDWMAGKLAATYFQSYRLAYQLCKSLERCYRYELGIPDSSFIQFGYWDSLHKGLLAGETLNHDLRRMQSSYLEQNRRRFEISRYVSLASFDAAALATLLATGECDFDLPESLFDHDYPGHYSRHLVRASVTVVYPTPGKFDNVKATLTLVKNKARVSTDTSTGYDENPVDGDARFAYTYASVPQKIVLGNGQDDPGLFLTAINNNLGDQRYLPFEGAGAISSWHLEMPAASNEIALNKVTDVVLHLFYTALDGGNALEAAALAG